MFYDTYIRLCKTHHVSASHAASAIGLSRAAVVKWRDGSVPRGDTITALAEYFGVPVGQLLGETPIPEEGEDELIAFYGQVKDDLDERDKADLIAYMRVKAELKRNNRKV